MLRNEEWDLVGILIITPASPPAVVKLAKFPYSFGCLAVREGSVPFFSAKESAIARLPCELPTRVSEAPY
jgi:hypothetical protein